MPPTPPTPGAASPGSATSATLRSLVAGAYHTGRAGGRAEQATLPLAEELEKIEEKDAAKLLSACEAAVRERNQARASALVHRYGTLGHDPRAAFDLLVRFAISEDGALHAEKYYRTVSEEFARTRRRSAGVSSLRSRASPPASMDRQRPAMPRHVNC